MWLVGTPTTEKTVKGVLLFFIAKLNATLTAPCIFQPSLLIAPG